MTLDLRAVEARLRAFQEAEFDERLCDDADALLAHCRALRAALQPFADRCPRGGQMETVADEIGTEIEFDAYPTERPHLTMKDWRRAAAVLAQARDE